MELKSLFAKEAILKKNGINHLYIEVIPDEQKIENKRPNLFMFIMDRSGSMGSYVNNNYLLRDTSCFLQNYNYQLPNCDNYIKPNPAAIEKETKLDYAINSITKFLNLSDEKDKIGIVAFDSIADIIQNITTISNNKNEIINNLRNIKTRGCTNISEPLQLAEKMIINGKYQNDYNCKIILLSDGQANEGKIDKDSLSSIALNCFNNNITISSLGIGEDYDSHILGSIAEKGNGLMYHIKNMDRLEAIFKEELNLSNKICGKSAKIIIKIPDLIEIKENLNGYVQKATNEGLEIKIGDIYNSRKIVLEIENNMVNDDMNFIIELDYENNSNNTVKITKSVNLKVCNTEEELKLTKENTNIIEYVLSLIKSNTIINASEGYETHDFRLFNNSFSSGICQSAILEKAYSSSPLIKNTISELNSMQSSYTNGKIDSNKNKELYERSYKNKK